MQRVVAKFQLQAVGDFGDGCEVGFRNTALQHRASDRSVHGTRVEEPHAESFCQQSGDRAFSGTGWSVNRDNHIEAEVVGQALPDSVSDSSDRA